MSDDDFNQLYFDDTDDQLSLLMVIATSEKMNVPEVRRIMHAMEGAAGLMGHDSLRVAIFEMCKRIERSGSNTQLRKACELLGACNQKLRNGSNLTETSEELVKKVI